MPLFVVAWRSWTAPRAATLYTTIQETSDQPTETAQDSTTELQVIVWPEFWTGRGAFYGWNSNADPFVAPPPEADTPSLFVSPTIWRGWRPQPQYGWFQAQDLAIGDASSPTPFVPRSTAFTRQPQYGWSQSQDQPATPEAGEGSFWTPTAPWRNPYRPQPQYGWAQANEQAADVPPGLGAEFWAPPTRPWPEWRRQPQYGWTTAQDFSSTVEAAPDACSFQIVAWWAYSAPKAAIQLYYGIQWAAEEQPPAFEGMAQAVQWYEFPRHPEYGWWQANDVVPPPPPGPTEPNWLAPVRQWKEWRRQPQYGWHHAIEEPPIVPAGNAHEEWVPPTRQWKEWRRQPSYGWTRAFDESSAPPTPGGIFIPLPRRRRR